MSPIFDEEPELSKIDGDSRDQMLFVKDSLAEKHGMLAYEIVPEDTIESRKFVMRSGADTRGGEVLVEGRWLKISPRLWNDLVNWIPGDQTEAFEINAWVMLKKYPNNDLPKVIGVALDGWPLFVGDW